MGDSRRQRFVDAHVHLEALADADLETLAQFGVERVLAIAGDGAVGPGRGSVSGWLKAFDALLGLHGPRARAHGLHPLFAVGVPPARAPWHGLEELLHKLPRYLSHPAVAAVGSLTTGAFDPREAHVLQRQLELASELRRPVLVALPVRASMRVLRRIIALARGVDLPPERVVIENVTPRALALADACGFGVALEASPGRLSARDITTAIRARGARRFVLTSHAGEGAADLLGVPSLVASLRDAGLPGAVVRRVSEGNAIQWLGRD